MAAKVSGNGALPNIKRERDVERPDAAAAKATHQVATTHISNPSFPINPSFTKTSSPLVTSKDKPQESKVPKDRLEHKEFRPRSESMVTLPDDESFISIKPEDYLGAMDAPEAIEAGYSPESQGMFYLDYVKTWFD